MIETFLWFTDILVHFHYFVFWNFVKPKKAAKKKERLAAMDAAGERQKKSWQSFNNKVVKKKKAGVVSLDMIVSFSLICD